MVIVRWFLSLWRRWRLRNELYTEKPDLHPALKSVQRGEILPWKGTAWKVASIRSEPIPCVILMPVDETRASKVHWLKKLRRADKIISKSERAARSSLEKRAQGA